ncbi:hypothetical protein [Paenibacillus thiaminolyticus]|uniref:hypothetical protein n=1 Tax=Paenibacillus thiaminolyticus TaxID=49283 RepID=UPI002543A254|nr:hypothetical protein [Paenibacillus thiaminolyticus]WII39123.1 hypothetical protein O0V01_08540 [Paenibacillus thiaminolyticus]
MNYLSRLERRLSEMMALFEQSVNMDFPSADKALTDRLIGWYEERFREQLQAEVERVPNELYGERLAVCKGSGRFLLSVQGRAQAAHAGVNSEAGISAVEELARQIIRLHSWSDRTAASRSMWTRSPEASAPT